MQCRVCQTKCEPYTKKTVLNKYTGHYFRCTHCRTIQIKNPHWLKEAYAMVLPPSADSAEPVRNKDNHALVKKIILANDLQGPFLDYGCGKGILVDLMVKDGLDYHGYDKYTKPGKMKEKYGLITAFEVIEHMENPMEEINTCLAATDILVFSTDLHRGNPDPRWPYFAAVYGQHITFYTMFALKFIANSFGRRLYSKGGTHAIASLGVDMSPWLPPVF